MESSILLSLSASYFNIMTVFFEPKSLLRLQTGNAEHAVSANLILMLATVSLTNQTLNNTSSKFSCGKQAFC